MALGVSSFAAALLAALALTNAVFATGGAAAGVPDQYRVNLRVFFRAFWYARSTRWFILCSAAVAHVLLCMTAPRASGSSAILYLSSSVMNSTWRHVSRLRR